MFKKIEDISIEKRYMRNAIIEITNKCNWKCKHCYLEGREESILPTEKIYDIFIQLRKLGVYQLTLTGGEIFTRKDIFDIIEKARSMGFKLNLFSNASLLNQTIVNKLVGYNINSFSSTIFSMEEKIHDEITRTKGSLRKALFNLNMLKESNISVEIKTCILKDNYKNFIDVYKFAIEDGYNYRIDYDIVPQVKRKFWQNECRLGKDEFKQVLKVLDGLKEKKFVLPNLNELLCSECRNSIVIDRKGNVKPCIKYQYVVGNIFDSDIFDIWNNSSKLNSIQNIKWKDLDECEKCNNRKYCHRCPLTNFDDNGIILNNRKNIECELANIRSEIYD